MTVSEKFEEISVCPFCDAPTEERFSGDEGFTFCTGDCGCLEGEKTVSKFVCGICGEICDEEKCPDCNNDDPELGHLVY